MNLPLKGLSRLLLVSLLSFSLSCARPKMEAEPVAPLSGEDMVPAPLSSLAAGEPSSPIPVEADDGRLGEPSAQVTLVAFLDYQCAFCAQGFASMLSLQEHYGPSRLRIVFKHLPLEFHELAVPAAIAGQAVMQEVGSEGFFRFSQLVFENQPQLSYQKLGEWAQDAGLSRERYNDLVQDESTVRRVAQDVQLARKLGVDATPAFYVNGRLIPGAQPLEYFQQVIDEEATALNETAGSEWRDKYQARVNENMRGSVLAALLSEDPNDYLVPVGDSPVRGEVDAPVTIVMFTDFECPYCKRAETTLGLVRKKYGTKVRFVFKHLPLHFHHSARPASLLAEAVHIHHGDRAFFRFTDAVFDRAPDLSDGTLRRLARQQGLTESQIREALAESDARLVDALAEDRDLADDVLARGTPHFFVNGKRLSGARPIEQFEALVDHGLERAHQLKASGVAPNEIYDTLQKGALSPGVPEKLTAPIPESGRPQRGPEDAPITIHTFSDFECPYCRKGEALLDELQAMYPDQLRVVWHDFPLDFHDRARASAQAAREAYVQKGDEGFWAMHRLLFGLDGSAPALSESEIVAHGRALELDMEKLKAAISQNTHNAAIGDDVDFGKAQGIRGTPAYIVAGYLVTGAKPKRHFVRLIERELETLQRRKKESGN